jgi:hypothetical protein
LEAQHVNIVRQRLLSMLLGLVIICESFRRCFGILAELFQDYRAGKENNITGQDDMMDQVGMSYT